MRIENLPSPGTLINGYDLRRQACIAISASEIYLSPESKAQLAEFFRGCAELIEPPKKVKAAPAVPDGTEDL